MDKYSLAQELERISSSPIFGMYKKAHPRAKVRVVSPEYGKVVFFAVPNDGTRRAAFGESAIQLLAAISNLLDDETQGTWMESRNQPAREML